MDIFEHRDYRKIVRLSIEARPKKGYGQINKLANELGVSGALISQVLSGAKNFTEDQGYLTARYFGFNESETSYFVLLVHRERVAHHQLKKMLDRQISQRQKESIKTKSKLVLEHELSFSEQAVYYSQWLYAAVHMLSTIPKLQSIDKMAGFTGVSRQRIEEIADWLASCGLCKKDGDKLEVGPSAVFVDQSSPLASRHHMNWRHKAFERMGEDKENNFFFTAPFTVSEEDYLEIRKSLSQFIGQLTKKVVDSKSETLANINIDLFKL